MNIRDNIISLSQKVVLVSQQNNAHETGKNGPLRLSYAHMRENNAGEEMHKSLNNNQFLPTWHLRGVLLNPVSQKYPPKQTQIFSYHSSVHNPKLDNLGCEHSGLIVSGVVIFTEKNGYWAFNSLCCVDIDSHFRRCLFLYGSSVCVCCLWDRADQRDVAHHLTWQKVSGIVQHYRINLNTELIWIKLALFSRKSLGICRANPIITVIIYAAVTTAVSSYDCGFFPFMILGVRLIRISIYISQGNKVIQIYMT